MHGHGTCNSSMIPHWRSKRTINLALGLWYSVYTYIMGVWDYGYVYTTHALGMNHTMYTYSQHQVVMSLERSPSRQEEEEGGGAGLSRHLRSNNCCKWGITISGSTLLSRRLMAFLVFRDSRCTDACTVSLTWPAQKYCCMLQQNSSRRTCTYSSIYLIPEGLISVLLCPPLHYLTVVTLIYSLLNPVQLSVRNWAYPERYMLVLLYHTHMMYVNKSRTTPPLAIYHPLLVSGLTYLCQDWPCVVSAAPLESPPAYCGNVCTLCEWWQSIHNISQCCVCTCSAAEYSFVSAPEGQPTEGI